MKITRWMLLMAVALFAIPCFAQLMQREFQMVDDTGWYGESSYNQGQYMDNPCTAVQDWVWVDYSAYVSGSQVHAGMDRYFFDESTTMGGMYAASGVSESDVDYGTSFTLRQYHKVNTPDDFHVVTVVNFEPGSHSTNVTVETACGDGSPYSAQ